MAVTIEQGVVEVTADVDRSSLTRTAMAAGDAAGKTLGDGIVRGADGRLRDAKGKFVAAGKDSGRAFSDGAGEGVNERKGSFLDIIKKAFTPNPDMFAQLRAPFAAALSTPIGAAAVAVAGVFAASFAAAAITAIAGIGLGTILLGIGGLALFGGAADRKKALDDLEKAEKKVKDAEFRARTGSATAVRSLAEARAQLQEAQKAVNDGKAFVALDTALKNVGDTIKRVATDAAKPLLKPFTTALDDISRLVTRIGPQFEVLFAALAPVVPLLTEGLSGFADGVMAGLADSMPGIVAAFSTFAEVLPTIGKWIGDFFATIFANEDVIDNVTESVLKFIFNGLNILGPAISGLTVFFSAFNNIIYMASEGFKFAGQTFMEFIDGSTGSIGRLKEAWGPLSDAIQNVWQKLIDFAGADTDQELADKFRALVVSIKEAWGPLKEFLSVVWEEAWVIIRNVWDTTVKPWWESVVKPWLKQKIKDAFQAAWDLAIAMVRQKVNQLIQATLSAIVGLPGRIASAIASIPSRIASIFATAVRTAVSGAHSVVTGAISVLATMAGRVTGALGSIRSRVIGAFSGAAGWLRSAGAAIVSGLIGGLTARIGSLRAAASNLGSIIKQYKGPIEYDRVMLVPEGQAIVEGLIKGMAQRAGALQGFVTSLSQAIPESVSGGTMGGLALAGGGVAATAPPSGSSTSISPSFNVQVYVGDKELKDTIRVEISEHDRAIGAQVASGTGGFRL